MKRTFAILPLFLFLLVTPAFAVNNRPQVSTKLNQSSLKSCQAKESAITKQISQLTLMSSNMISVFDKISDRVKNHYINTIVPSGKTVSNYASLVADIEAKRANVLVALSQSQTTGTGFTCTGGDPKGLMAKYKANMSEVKNALKVYRNSINNLITAVRSVTPTPTPSTSTAK